MRVLAQRHLPPDVRERWLELLRPTARLLPASGSDRVVGRLGGLPRLPAEVAWPVWEGRGPLTFIASVDCAQLPLDALDIRLPTDGTLLFFCFDGQIDQGAAPVIAVDRDTWPGARVLHLPAGTECAERQPPPRLRADVRSVPLTARVEPTAASGEHPLIHEAFLAGLTSEAADDHPVNSEEFEEAVWAEGWGPGHRIGGHAWTLQGPVEIEAAAGVLGAEVAWDSPELLDEAKGWLLLAQIDCEEAEGVVWDDTGALYWLIRPEDLAARSFDRAICTFQC